MTLDAAEFIRRFLMHTLPPGFPRIRYFGLLPNRHRKHHLARCRQLLTSETAQLLPSIAQCQAARRDRKLVESARCPLCRAGVLFRVALAATLCLTPLALDTS